VGRGGSDVREKLQRPNPLTLASLDLSPQGLCTITAKSEEVFVQTLRFLCNSISLSSRCYFLLALVELWVA
jgi:hypothetical protein